MSTSGWYPDPGGAPGRYRYWDGQAWSAGTSASPADAPPGGGPGSAGGGRDGRPAGSGRGTGRRRAGPWIALAALVVVLALVLTLVARHVTDRRTADPGPLPTSTVSGGNDSTPSSSPAPPGVSATPTPTPSASSPTPSAVPCPAGEPTARQPHPSDGRIHGGGLSFPRQPGWTYPGIQTVGFSWAYDVGETDHRVEPQWFAAYAVGALSVNDGFESPRTAAETVMGCTASSDLYRGFTGRRDVVSRATTVDGHPAWTIRSEIRVDTDRTTFSGDVVQVTVVDVDSPESLAFFWGCAPIGDTALTEQLDQAVSQLHAE